MRWATEARNRDGKTSSIPGDVSLILGPCPVPPGRGRLFQDTKGAQPPLNFPAATWQPVSAVGSQSRLPLGCLRTFRSLARNTAGVTPVASRNARKNVRSVPYPALRAVCSIDHPRRNSPLAQVICFRLRYAPGVIPCSLLIALISVPRETPSSRASSETRGRCPSIRHERRYASIAVTETRAACRRVRPCACPISALCKAFLLDS